MMVNAHKADNLGGFEGGKLAHIPFKALSPHNGILSLFLDQFMWN